MIVGSPYGIPFDSGEALNKSQSAITDKSTVLFGTLHSGAPALYLVALMAQCICIVKLRSWDSETIQ